MVYKEISDEKADNYNQNSYINKEWVCTCEETVNYR